jgi:hypothetical protein
VDASGVEDEAYLCCWVENDSASTCPALCYGGLALHARKRLRVTCPAMKTYDRTVYLAVFLLVLGGILLATGVGLYTRGDPEDSGTEII